MTLFTLVLLTFFPAVVISKDYYTAAVFEHKLRSEITVESKPIEVIKANLKYFERAAKTAAHEGADIIVFNEYGIVPYFEDRKVILKYTENIPDPEKREFNPCNEGSEDFYILSTLSCLARDNNLYIVANMLDRKECESHCHIDEAEDCQAKCSDDGVLIYNTNVAFDRKGNLIARYHKMHPYFEVVNVPEEPEFVTFDTDFGRFGLIVCFDSVFEESYRLKIDHGIDTLVFTTYWFDDVVPLNAVEWQQSWALANKVNFLAANVQNASTGSLGSGIYSKFSGALAYTYDNDGDSKLLLANVRIEKDGNVPPLSSIIVFKEDATFIKDEATEVNFPEQCFNDFVGPAKDEKEYRCFKSQLKDYTLSKLSSASGVLESCNNGFCCKLQYLAENLQEDWYLAAFNGTNNVYDFYHWREETCLLVRCDPFESKECVMLPSISNTVFKSLELSANFNAERVYPTVSKNKYRLASTSEWNYEHKGPKAVIKFQSDSKIPLLKVALLGRNYSQDPPFEPYYKYSLPENPLSAIP